MQFRSWGGCVYYRLYTFNGKFYVFIISYSEKTVNGFGSMIWPIFIHIVVSGIIENMILEMKINITCFNTYSYIK